MSRRSTRTERRLRSIRVDVGNAEAFTTRSRRVSGRLTKSEVGSLMLLLAADAVLEDGREERDMLSTERLALKMGLLNMNHAPLGSPELPKNFSDVDGSASSAGDSDSVVERAINPSQADEEYTNVPTHPFLIEHILLNVMEFLPWESLLRTRGVNKFFFRLSLSFLSVCRPPRSTTPALFIPCHEDLLMNEDIIEAQLSSARGSWVCSECGMLVNLRTSRLKPCCQNSRPEGQRMFIGQLRRDGTVPMVKWLMSTVLQVPSDALISVENHRNKTSNRGKGCAWVTLRESAVSSLLKYHHRIFFDSVRGVEGVWVVPSHSREMLATVASVRGSMPDRAKHMPRNTLVVEMPLSVLSPVPPPPRPAIPIDRMNMISLTPPPLLPLPMPLPPTSSMSPPPYDVSSMLNQRSGPKPRGPWRHDPYSFSLIISPQFHY
ncbi:uncharacterized protein TM35_000192540 [Trypanosoma theileri]|uniref:F-box domain-containing protein n=1 Tax=Trypanosoma theileri TaxID=67003 RepID=A0A1X0NV61_9TRYP|nr:uncharacterized protein TM35_000192540 [Trypanosoma theileri]ORC88010.1 hypothetical protein TM35_000192540 [Trypanosoma theileri]